MFDPYYQQKIGSLYLIQEYRAIKLKSNNILRNFLKISVHITQCTAKKPSIAYDTVNQYDNTHIIRNF